ncbi:MAG: hypothetical protein GWO16_00880 [Gammaproteobacteria bacterium]|nr:hypothetical protein [Gammaproteobacteria bacterium]NIR96690.1 hypothetical protein [Gammaproteobacteria bacterium]NIT62394.1 hypothetical protein [Gammaproteobacteria bacterium]NIV19326.1 hypothetical protein [Gammaproteobacteria bacterium]NIX10287.1 hypothetical protein [Gammaproteobacteria bacterium]
MARVKNTVTDDTITLEQLRRMIGSRVRHQGLVCEIIEILEDGPSLVLSCGENPVIQSDQYGNPTRRGPRISTVPVTDADGRGMHPSFLALERLDD